MQLHINEFDSIGGQITAAYSTMEEGVPAEWQAVAASGNAVLLTTPNGVAVVSAPRHSGRVAEAIGADAGLPEAWLGWAFGRQSEADVWAARAAGAARTLLATRYPDDGQFNQAGDDWLRASLEPIPQRLWHTLPESPE